MRELREKLKIESDGHIFQSYDWDASDGWQQRLAAQLLPLIRKLYLDCDGLKNSLTDLGLSPEKIEEFLEVAIKATIPNPTQPGPTNFKVTRSDFAELLALICLENLCSTCIPANNIFHRELTQSVSKGIDILGYENTGNLALIICEAKGSSDKNSPPGVVEAGDDCLKKQLFSYVTDKKKTLNRIINLHKKSPPEHKLILAKLAVLWGRSSPELKVVIVPFLVRQANVYQDTDFGCFKSKPAEFAPAKIRFLVVCVHEDLESISRFVFEEARKS